MILKTIRERLVTMTITRVTEAEGTVTGRHVFGAAPTGWQPGEPEQTIIESAVDGDGQPVKLTEAEGQRVARCALKGSNARNLRIEAIEIDDYWAHDATADDEKPF